MLDIKYIKENKEEIQENCKNRLVEVDINGLLSLDEERRALIQKKDKLRSQRNKGSKGKPTAEEIENMKKVRKEISIIEERLKETEENLNKILFTVPNLTHKDVHISTDEDDNPVLETVGEKPKFDFTPRDHVELAKINNLIDFDNATKVSGAKFYYLKNELALMEFALIQYALDTLVKKGFTPFITPDLAKKDVLANMGYNPRGESTQIYNIENSDLSLIGTSEITMGAYHMNKTFNTENELPKKYIALSHCFRTEAGSYSKYSKGIFRVHQFTKAEMFIFTTPENSEKLHKELLDIQKEIFKGLEVPFQVVDHCTADLGTPAIRTYDLEAWMPGKPNKDGGMGDWAEITSVSNCTDYQSRALNIKYVDENSKKQYVHLLNGTAISLARALISIIENHQEADGSIKIPEKLQKYMIGNIKKITKK